MGRGSEAKEAAGHESHCCCCASSFRFPFLRLFLFLLLLFLLLLLLLLLLLNLRAACSVLPIPHLLDDHRRHLRHQAVAQPRLGVEHPGKA